MPSPLENYTLLEIIGYGTYGVVYRARHLETQEVVAIKRIRLRQTGNRGLSKTVRRELSALREMPRHENIIKLREFVEDRERAEVCFVFEYMNLDLRKHLDMTGNLPRDPLSVRYIVYQMLCGLKHCHEHNLAHRDLKPQNLLLDTRTCQLKIGDFGLSRNYVAEPPGIQPLTPEIMTMWYKAPEILLGSLRYTSAIDMWAAGCIFAELCMKQPLFPGRTEIEQMSKIFQMMGTPSEITWPGVSLLQQFMPLFPLWRPRNLTEMVKELEPRGLDLLSQMLILNPANRITAREALQHAYFQDTNSDPEDNNPGDNVPSDNANVTQDQDMPLPDQ